MEKKQKRPGSPARGTRSGRPIMVLLDVLGRRWTLRILWELRSERLAFRSLRTRCDDVSPTVLNDRLKQLRALGVLDHDVSGYGLTVAGAELAANLLELDQWANNWAQSLDAEAEPGAGKRRPH